MYFIYKYIINKNYFHCRSWAKPDNIYIIVIMQQYVTVWKVPLQDWNTEMLMSYLFELVSHHWEERKLPLNSEKPHCRWPEGSWERLWGTGAGRQLHTPAPAHESHTPTAWPASSDQALSRQDRHTITKRLISQKLQVSAHNHSRPVLSRPCCTSSLAMAQVTVMISLALRRWTPSAVSSELERRDCSAGCR